MKSGSKYVQNIIKQAENGKISQEEARNALDKYKEGQKTCVDVVADMASGILAVGAFALAVPTGGASLAVGLAAATTVGAGVKIGIKGIDAATTGKEYNGKDLLYDFATGAVNGIMAPVTNGLGNCVTKTIGKKLGLEVLEEGVEQTAKQLVTQTAKQGITQTAKSVILTKSVDVAGGNIIKRAISLGAGMAVDGALGGASDNMVRAALNGDDIAKAGIQGAIGGMIMSPIIGGGFRIAGKAGNALNNKITTKFVLPDGVNTVFKQGSVGDCALLSTLDGMMNNSETANLIKKSITKTPFGDYNVKIGNTTVRVTKSSLSDEILSDTTGIKIFEQAYKNLTGDIDGGFAEVVAKQFGLNPVHITSEGITDEILDKIAREQNNTVLSLGALVDTDGAITIAGTQRHYFTIKNIDPDNKMVILSSPVDTSKTIELSYDQVKSLGISIDGGCVKKTDLPNMTRSENEAVFFGKTKKAQTQFIDNVHDTGNTISKMCENLSVSENELKKILEDIGLQEYSPEKIAAILDLNNINPTDFTDLFSRISNVWGVSSIKDADIEVVFTDTLKILQIFSDIKENPILGAFHLSLNETYDLYDAVLNSNSPVDDIYRILRNNNKSICEEIQAIRTDDGKDIISANFYNLYNLFFNQEMSNIISPEDIADLGIINGQRKLVIFPNASSIPNSAFNPNPEVLIKSNMITTDIIDIALRMGIDIPKTCKINIKVPNVKNIVRVSINPSELIERLQKYGIDSLSSNEIHALTDMFSDIYKTNPQFSKAVNQFVNSSKSVSQIYNFVQYLKTLASKELSDGSVQIEDHVFMRMLDRNLVTVTDNESSQILSFEQFIKLLKENVLKNRTEITGINGSDGIKMIVKGNGKGRFIIDSIM